MLPNLLRAFPESAVFVDLHYNQQMIDYINLLDIGILIHIVFKTAFKDIHMVSLKVNFNLLVLKNVTKYCFEKFYFFYGST